MTTHTQTRRQTLRGDLMLPYQIYQALMDEHVHELQAAAHRRERAAEVRRAAAYRATRSARLKGAFGHLAALAHVKPWADVQHGAPAGPTTQGSRSTASTAGPMGCVA
jgi:hypothetical protein